MGRIPDEDVSKVRDATDIASLVGESIQLKRKGRLLWGLCPFHGEKTPSFKVDPSTQLWHCFGCGEGGDAFGFLMRTENVDFPESVRILARRANIEIREEGGERSSVKERLAAACDATADFYHLVLTSSREPAANAAREYLKRRGFGSEVAKRFQLGYAPGRGALVAHLREAGFTPQEMETADLVRARSGSASDRFFERIMFPIYDLRGRCVGFGGRVLGDGNPKYLNTGETPLFHKSENLYGINWAKNAIVRAGEAVVVEGYTDAIALHVAGIENVVATLGTALTQQHMRVLTRFAPRVIYLFDGDEAGRRAADRAIEMVDWAAMASGAQKIELAVALIPGGKDPADHVAEAGAEAMSQTIEAAVPLARYALDRTMERHDLSLPEGRSAALGEAAKFLVPLGESLLGQDYRRYVAGKLMIDYETVRHAVSTAPRESPRSQGRRSFGSQEAGGARVDGGAPRGEGGGAREAGAPSQGAGPVGRPARIDTPQDRAEREAVRLAAALPELRGEARQLLTEDLLTSTMYRVLLERVLESDGLVKNDLYAAVREHNEEAAAELTGLLVEAAIPPKADVAFQELLTKLKEYALERLILERKSEMRAAEGLEDRARRDELFREISALTMRLERFKSGRGPIHDDDERDRGTSDR